MKKILICEDEKGVQDYLKSNLTNSKYEVYVAADGQEAIDKVKVINPDLILLDIRMPKVNGLEAAEEIRKFNKISKIIFITGFQSPELSKEAKKYNIFDYVVKTAPTEDIMKVINAALKD